MRNWFARYERPVSSLSLIGGFVFDAITLKRVDLFWDNFWVVAHLVIVAACIILINREENEGSEAVFDSKDPAKLHFWLVNILQFFFGGLLSTFIVFYFRGAVLAVAWPFILVLIAAFIANESLKQHYTRISFQIAFLFLSILLFAIFFVPVLLHQIGPAVFLMSGGLSLIVLLLFLWTLRAFAAERFKKSRGTILGLIAGIYAVVGALYFFNLIPPLPLSLQDAGIFHSIRRSTSGDYTVTLEHQTTWDAILEYVDIYPAYHAIADTSMYAYSAVYSPVSFNTQIIHEWQLYDDATKKWLTQATIPLSVSGGRENGYRTYSVFSASASGKWRVNVKTASGQLIGRMSFHVFLQDSTPSLLTETKK